ncbi:MAG: hypothetical protein WBM09_12365 [Gallionella sp.]
MGSDAADSFWRYMQEPLLQLMQDIQKVIGFSADFHNGIGYPFGYSRPVWRAHGGPFLGVPILRIELQVEGCWQH